MPQSDMPASVASSPVVIYVGIGLAVAAMILAFFPKILPPFAKFLDQRAQMKRTGVDRRFNDMDQQLEFFQAQLTEEREGRAKDRRDMEAEIARVRANFYSLQMRVSGHIGWDWNTLLEIRKHNPDYPDAPPLLEPAPLDERTPPPVKGEETP